MRMVPGVFTALWLCCILILSTVNVAGAGPGRSFPHADKLMHVFMYGVLMALWLWEKRREPPRTPNLLALVASAAFLYGLLMEMVQLYLPNRSFEPADLLANTLGIAVAMGGHEMINHKPRRDKK